MRGNRKWAAAAAVALAETAVGAGPRGAGTGRGPAEQGESRSCWLRERQVPGEGGRGFGRARRTWVTKRDSGPSGTRTDPGPLPSSRRGCPGPHPGKRAGRQGSWRSRALCFKSLMGLSGVHLGVGRTAAAWETQCSGGSAAGGGRVCGPGVGGADQEVDPGTGGRTPAARPEQGTCEPPGCLNSHTVSF